MQFTKWYEADGLSLMCTLCRSIECEAEDKRAGCPGPNREIRELGVLCKAVASRRNGCSLQPSSASLWNVWPCVLISAGVFRRLHDICLPYLNCRQHTRLAQGPAVYVIGSGFAARRKSAVIPRTPNNSRTVCATEAGRELHYRGECQPLNRTRVGAPFRGGLASGRSQRLEMGVAEWEPSERQPVRD